MRILFYEQCDCKQQMDRCGNDHVASVSEKPHASVATLDIRDQDEEGCIRKQRYDQQGCEGEQPEQQQACLA